MRYDLFTVLGMCGACALTLWFIGVCMLRLGVHKGRNEFRIKGYLRTPSGTRWFRFLMYKHYDIFEDRGTRVFFGIAHFCMVGLIVVFTGIVVLIGSEQLLNSMSGLPAGGITGSSSALLPK